jgi:hypothetical protein
MTVLNYLLLGLAAIYATILISFVVIVIAEAMPWIHLFRMRLRVIKTLIFLWIIK